jgi:hypothetical protein
VVVVEPIEPERRSRRTLIAVTVGVVVAAVLVAYGFARSDDDRAPASTTTAVIGVIQAPAEVATTQARAVPSGSTPATNDVPTVPTGTADVIFPPASSDIPAP